MHVYTYVCTHVPICMYAHMYVYIHAYRYTYTCLSSSSMYICDRTYVYTKIGNLCMIANHTKVVYILAYKD